MAAQQISFEAIPPGRPIREGEKFALTFRLNNASASAPRQPQVDGCTLLYGPATSTRQSYSVVNGQVTSSSSVDFVYTYRADREGTYTISPTTINVDGKTYSSKSFQIRIIKGSGQGAQQSGTSRPSPVDMDDPDTQRVGQSVSNSDVFVRVNLSKAKAYEQEAIVCTIKLYTKYQISSFMPTLQPSFDGFLIQELDLQPSLNEVESVNGQNYMTAVLKKCILFPQHSGELTINSGNYDISVVQYERINMGIMSVSNPVEKKIKVSSNKASVNILPLPQPQPPHFSGAVGTFKVEDRLVGSSYKTEDAASMIYTISGTGNIKYLKEPTIDFPSEFELYEPQSEIDAHVSGGNVTGKVTINYTFVPKTSGNFHINVPDFVYFDPTTTSYVTLKTNSFDIKVAQGNEVSASGKQEIVSKNTDILHIHQGVADLRRASTPVITRVWYWLLYLAAMALLGEVFYLNRRRIKLEADVKGIKMAKAGKMARKQLKIAKSYLDSNNSDKFYEALLLAVTRFISEKMDIPQSKLSRENIAEKLASFGANNDTIERVVKIIDECEMAKYTPAGSSEELMRLYDSAAWAINELSSIKKKN